MRMSKNGVDFFDVDDSDESQAAARAKGYKPYFRMTKNGKDVFDVEGTEDSYKAAVDKGYKDVEMFKFQHKKADAGAADAAMRGTAQGASGGFADEAYGVVGALVNPTNSDKGFLDRYRDSRDYARGGDASAAANHEGIYQGSALAGGVAAAATGVGIGQIAGQGLRGAAALGAASGLGTSDADLTRGDVAGAGIDTAIGTGAGLAGYGVAKALPQVAKGVGYVGKKAGRILTGVSEDATGHYMANPSAVNAAKPLGDVTRAFLDKADEVGTGLSEDSAAAFKMLGKYETAPDAFAQPLKAQAQKLQELGTFGPERKAAIEYLGNLVDDVTQHAGEKGTIGLDKGKGLLNVLDKKIAQADRAGADTQTIKAFVQARRDIDAFLKESVPEYAEHMRVLAGDTKALTGLTNSFRTDQGAANALKRIQSGKDTFARDALQKFDDRFESSFGEDLKNSYVKDAFTRDTTAGSRKTLLGSIIGSAAGGVGGPLGGAVGSTVGAGAGAAADKLGGQVYKAILDGVLKAGKYAPAFQRAFEERGPAAVAALHVALKNQDPEYAKAAQEAGG